EGIVAGGPGGQHYAHYGIDHAKKNQVGGFDHEVVDTAPERIEKIGNMDLANPGMFLHLVGACNNVKVCHDRFLPGSGPAWLYVRGRSRLLGAAIRRSGSRLPRPAPTAILL